MFIDWFVLYGFRALFWDIEWITYVALVLQYAVAQNVTLVYYFDSSIALKEPANGILFGMGHSWGRIVSYRKAVYQIIQMSFPIFLLFIVFVFIISMLVWQEIKICD